MARRTMIAVGVAALAVIGVTALPATGQDSKPTGTITFTGKGQKRDQQVVDVGRKGLSLGDRFLLSETLKHGGATGGRIEADCVVLDQSYEGQACQLTLLLKDGQVTAQGALASTRGSKGWPQPRPRRATNPRSPAEPARTAARRERWW